ncbi:MAG TPA: FapA family protein [Burkholderiaceae bacterium]
MEQLIADKQNPAGSTPELSFLVDEKSGEVQALYEPRAVSRGLERHQFDAALQQAGHGEIALNGDAIATFCAQSKTTTQALHAVIGVRRDAEFWISIAEDFMTATLTMLPAQGGTPVGVKVEDAMREQGIMHGIDHEALDAALMAGYCDSVIIARGTPPKEGIPAQFETMLRDREKVLQEHDDNAVIKFRDLGHLMLVEPGARLMHRTPPVQGHSGIDVLGDVVFPRPLPEMEFGDAFTGAVCDPADPNMLLAGIAGQPVVLENGVIVNPVIEVANVDLTTGNIAFDGTIHVSGDIKAGMIVKVAGDVIVEGTLEAAEVVAGGNVAVAGGIIGRTDARPGATLLPADTARINCKGSVKALFIENAHVEAGDSILIERSVRQCELIALNDIIVGDGESKNSTIVGGLTQAKHLVRVSVLGSSAGVKTRVQVGLDPFVTGNIAEAQQTLASKNSELERVLQLTLFFRQNPKKGEGGVAEKVNATRERLLNEIADLSTKLEVLNENMALDQDARIEVSKALYFGTEVRIGTQLWQVKDDTKGTVIGIEDGRIVTGMSARAVSKPKADDPPPPKQPPKFG